MTDPASIPLSGPFRMTDALRRTFGVVFSAPLLLFGIAFLIQIPSTLLTIGWGFWLAPNPELASEVQATYSCVEVPVGLATALVSQAAMVMLVFARLRGDVASAWESLRVGLSRLLPLLGLTLLVSLGTSLGMLLCFVPGVIVYTCTFVAVPALLVEETAVSDAWQRSFDLTRGYRWEVFGVVFVLFVIGFVVGALSVFLWPAMFEDPGNVSGALRATSVSVTVLSNLVSTVLAAVAAAVVYHDLRLTKEGLGEEELLAVFA